jgi:DNA-directed RNA polymerase beta subunit
VSGGRGFGLSFTCEYFRLDGLGLATYYAIMPKDNPNLIDDAERPAGVELYDFEDHKAHRKLIFDGVRDTMSAQFPVEHNGVRMELEELDYADPEEFSLADQKKALLEDKFLSRRLRGTVRLTDAQTGEELDRSTMTLMRVPYLTERGTYVHGGAEYASIAQNRLLPGAYSRRQENGELETQFNTRFGTGSAFRVNFHPETSQYRLRVKQSNIHMYSLLKELGVTDEELEKRWGRDVLDANRQKFDRRALERAYKNLVPKYKYNEGAGHEEMVEAVKDAFAAGQIAREVAQKTLPNLFNQKVASEWRKQAGYE